jgi:Protein of unknown function (DUF4244)
MARKGIHWFRRRLLGLAVQDAGLVTAEYAVVTLVGAAFGGILFAIVASDTVRTALTQIIERALSVNLG